MRFRSAIKISEQWISLGVSEASRFNMQLSSLIARFLFDEIECTMCILTSVGSVGKVCEWNSDPPQCCSPDERIGESFLVLIIQQNVLRTAGRCALAIKSS